MGRLVADAMRFSEKIDGGTALNQKESLDGLHMLFSIADF